jgi:precorrin-2/cobalt-factor-2 C20-methyltransferase
MRKTSVYLSDETKDALRQVSLRWNRSEAQLIREAVDRLIRSADSEPAPSSALASARFQGPRLIGVGVGPSAPDLITQRAVAILQRADRVFAASTAPDAISRAETIVRSAAPDVAVDRLPFVVAENSDALDQSFGRAVDALVAVVDRGEVAAFITLGDPNVYSVFSELVRRVRDNRPGVPVSTVPGIMAFQELAASTGTVLAEGDEHIDIGTVGNDETSFARALDDARTTVVLYKGGRRLPEVATQLRHLGRLDGAVIGELMGLPGGRNGPVADVAERPASYLATVVVPALRADRS